MRTDLYATWTDDNRKPRPHLFNFGDFTLHSGAKSNIKINCDAFSDDDWNDLARYTVDLVPPFESVYGVPTGGDKFADALRAFVTPNAEYILIVDDVVTTGDSMTQLADEVMKYIDDKWVLGVAVFDRREGPPEDDDWIMSLLSVMHHDRWL